MRQSPPVRLTASRTPLWCTLTLCLALLTCATGCDYFERAREGEVLLAEVGEQRLYNTDLAAKLVGPKNAADSLAQLRQLVDQWTRRAAMLDEAEGQLGGDVEIERLVADYRASLLLDRYQEQLYASVPALELDEAQVAQRYQEAGAATLAQVPLVRAILNKVEQPIPDKEAFERAWYSQTGAEHQQAVEAFAKTHANLSLLDRERWYPEAELAALLPQANASSIQPGTRVLTQDGFAYYLRVIERVAAGQPAPLSYVRPQLLAAARQQHRAAFLAERANASFQAARQRNDVKIYLDD